MKVLSVVETLELGGAESVLVDLVLGLPEHQHRVVHFSAANRIPAHLPYRTALAAAGVPVLDTHWKMLRQEESRRSALDGFLPEVVLFHWWGKDPFRGWVLDQAERPNENRTRFVLVLHCAGIPAPSGYDRYVLVTPTQWAQVAAIPQERVRVIPNGVDLRRFAVATRRDAGFVVGRLSALRPGKIPADFVRTAAAWDLPSARFVIAGDGSLRERLQADAHDLGVAGRFYFPGAVARVDVPRLLAGFDVFCHLTTTAVECHPLALLESLAAGVRIVAEARGGIPDIVEHGVNGFLARGPADVEGLLGPASGPRPSGPPGGGSARERHPLLPRAAARVVPGAPDGTLVNG